MKNVVRRNQFGNGLMMIKIIIILVLEERSRTVYIPFIIGGIKYNGCVCNSGSCKSGRKSNGDETCAIEVDSDGKATKMGVCNMSTCIKCDKGK